MPGQSARGYARVGPMPVGNEDGTFQLQESSREYRTRRFRLKIVAGPDKGKAVTSEGDELSVGTSEGNHLILADRTVSRHHFSITHTPRGFLLRDLGSTNGTEVSNITVQSAMVPSKSMIRIGRSVIRFDMLDGSVSHPLSDADSFGEMLGRSTAIRRVFGTAERVAMTESKVLIEGETGTGKTLLAEMIHARSARADGPFVTFDCGSVTPTLIESALFGHVKGAFSGADRDRPGAFTEADGGTLFIDELGELPLGLQPKLLRVLEEPFVTPLGTQERRAVDVRLITATNRDLREQVNDGHFREDLFYRIGTLRIRVPPLRERPEDILFLAEHFYTQLIGDGATPPAELLEQWQRLPWRGNVRELRHAIERAVVLGDQAAAEHIAERQQRGAGELFDPAIAFRQAKEHVVTRWEARYLAELFERHDKNISKAARAARMDRNHLRELLKRHELLS